MLLVETIIKKTKNKGIGLFANEFIAKGKIFWIYDDDFVKTWTLQEVEKMYELQRKFMYKYASVMNDLWYLCLDDCRFINHSNRPNTDVVDRQGSACVALRDIRKGVEITCDYRKICNLVRDRPSFFLRFSK